jgi:hypothetical protein
MTIGQDFAFSCEEPKYPGSRDQIKTRPQKPLVNGTTAEIQLGLAATLDRVRANISQPAVLAYRGRTGMRCHLLPSTKLVRAQQKNFFDYCLPFLSITYRYPLLCFQRVRGLLVPWLEFPGLRGARGLPTGCVNHSMQIVDRLCILYLHQTRSVDSPLAMHQRRVISSRFWKLVPLHSRTAMGCYS